MDTIESIKLNNVEIQANGIIRNEKGRLIGRLVDDVDFKGEHISGIAKNEFDFSNFKRELAKVINCCSRENLSNTPDYILAEYINDCLNAYEKTIKLTLNIDAKIQAS